MQLDGTAVTMHMITKSISITDTAAIQTILTVSTINIVITSSDVMNNKQLYKQPMGMCAHIINLKT